MSPIYEDETTTIADLNKMRRRSKCQVCGARLNVYLDSTNNKIFLACWDWPRSHHEGIERERSRYEKEGLASLNIKTRREIMENDYGKETTTALEKARLPMTGALTQPQAMHILKLVYPDVPEDQIIRTAILCRDFGLHPLMKEVYIIGYKNTKTGKTDYSTVLGIAANRKLAADKKGPYSFLDDTPRAASEAEIIKQFGKNSEEEKDNLISFCKLKGEKGNEAIGFGLWPKDEEPKAKKGNTKRNMCNIRSERQAIDRLPGPAVPLRGFEVIDVDYAMVPDVGKVDTKTGEIVEGEFEELKAGPKEHWCEEHNCPFEKKHSRFGDFYAHSIKDANGKPILDAKGKVVWCNEIKKKDTASKPELKYSPVTTDMPDAAAEQAFTPPDEPEEPSPNTIEALKETMQLCNWSAMAVGAFCNSDKSWGIKEYSDLTPDQLAELIDHIKRNPK